MNLYLLGIIFFLVLIIVGIFLLRYFIKDEKKLKEVSNEDLQKRGKKYTKEEIEEKMFNQYINIEMSMIDENYGFLRDAVSDQIYNQILLQIKENQKNQVKNKIQNVRKEFCKLIYLGYEQNLEIAKFWIRYSSIEYQTAQRNEVTEAGKEIVVERVVQGNDQVPIYHEYILTFVKDPTETEEIVCPHCGYQTNMLTSSKCIRCDSEIIPKSKHWVFVNKVTTNISKQK